MESHFAAISKDKIVEGNIREIAELLGCTRETLSNRVAKGDLRPYNGWVAVEAWKPEWRCYSKQTGELLATAETSNDLSAKMYYARAWAGLVKKKGSQFYEVNVYRKYTPEYYEAVRMFYYDPNRMSDDEMEEIAQEVLNEAGKSVI